MDMFGSVNHGSKYHIFRPSPPLSLLNKIASNIRGKNKYLDVATGTGKLLLHFAPMFKQSAGIDISPKMIQTATTNLTSFQLKHQLDVAVYQADIATWETQDKFDLITIGQALHFMPRAKTFEKIKTNLSPQGIFAVTGYIIKAVRSETDPHDSILFSEFYSKVKPEFSFNREQLENHYSEEEKYPFQKYFPCVDKTVMQVVALMSKEEYIGYLKSMSGYNNFLKKYPESDPIFKIERQKAKQVLGIFDHFVIICY